MTDRVIDVRPADDFQRGHRAGALNLPLEEIDQRIHELPPTGARITLFDKDPSRAQAAMERLSARARWELHVATGPDFLNEGSIEQGPSRARLWEPHPWLADALGLIEGSWGTLNGRRAVDLASGTGRDAVYLALRGLDVEAVDILPDALQRADHLAARYAAKLRTRIVDLEKNNFLDTEQFDLVVVFNYLQRSLFDNIRSTIRPGGFAVVEAFLVAQRERFGKPARDAHLLQPGELSRLFSDWRILRYREGESGPRRIAAGIVAQKPGPHTTA